MSYILDALKKSEQERRRGEMPEITRFDSETGGSSATRSFWPIVVIVLLVVNAAGVIIWAPWETDQAVSHATNIAPRESISKVDQPLQVPVPVAQSVSKDDTNHPKVSRHSADFKAVTPKPTRPPVVEPPQKAATTVESTPKPEVIKPSVSQVEPYVEPVQTSYLPQLQELPSSLQARVPDMSFSSHMYSSQPKYRSIIINGRRLKEGQFLNDDIQVREITDKGVILGLDGTVFEVDVLGQWVN